MTKELYPIAGRIFVTVRVTSIRNKKKFVSTETGTNSMNNVSRDYKEKIRNAHINAIYKHMNRGGGSDATTELIDYDITYFKDKVKLIKEKKTNKKGVTKTYAYGVSKTTGKRVFPARIVKKAKKDEFSSQSL